MQVTSLSVLYSSNSFQAVVTGIAKTAIARFEIARLYRKIFNVVCRKGFRHIVMIIRELRIAAGIAITEEAMRIT
jgi:hypothetical protein